MELVLASASDRRKELLTRITEDFKIVVSDFNEELIDFDGDCSKYVMKLSEGKALNSANKIEYDAIIIGCDTIVCLENKILHKPKDKSDAVNMLKELSGRTHKVYTGVTLYNNKTCEKLVDFCCTDVVFSDLDDEQIDKYVNTNDPYDKAGAYGIQGKAGIFVKEIKGDYYSVVGLPLNKLNNMLKEMGVNF